MFSGVMEVNSLATRALSASLHGVVKQLLWRAAPNLKYGANASAAAIAVASIIEFMRVVYHFSFILQIPQMGNITTTRCLGL